MQVAALMVLEVLVRCKGLRYLHYFSGYTWFDIAFHPLLSKTTSLLNNELGCNFLERFGQVAVTQVCGLVGGSSGYVRLPSVSLLAGLFTSTTFELSPSSRIRSLDLGATLLDSDTITSVLSSFRNLEVLRYDMAHPSIATYALTTDYLSILQVAIGGHRGTLQELSLTSDTAPNRNWDYLKKLSWSFADYPKLTTLEFCIRPSSPTAFYKKALLLICLRTSST
jgi:hypothetical protein